MAEYYRTTYSSGGERKKKSRSFVGILLDAVMLLVSIVVVAAFVLTLFVPTIDPRNHGFLSTVGHVAPFVYVAQAVMTLYWIVRWRLWLAVPMVLISLFGLGGLSTFYKIEVSRSYGEKSYERSALKIMSYNVRSFINDDGARRLDSIVMFVKAANPDILCFQEMGFSELADSLLKPLKPMPKSLSRVDLSPAVYSKYPVINTHRVDSVKNFLWVDLVVKDDTIRVFNNHLQSATIQHEDIAYIENHEYIADEERSELRSVVDRLSANNKLRAAQVDSLKVLIDSSPYPVIVCGDFNDTPVSYTYRNMSKGLKDAFREVGRGFSHTFKGFFGMLRIDYVLCSDEFEPLSYEVVDSVKYSDHHPVFVRLRYNGKTN